jgi:hypothetical protein
LISPPARTASPLTGSGRAVPSSHRQEDGVARHIVECTMVPRVCQLVVAGLGGLRYGKLVVVCGRPLEDGTRNPRGAQGLAMPCDSENIPLSNAVSPRGLRPPSRPVNAGPFAGPLHCRPRPGLRRGGDLLGGRVLVHLVAVPIALPCPSSPARFHATARGDERPRPAEICWMAVYW